MFYDIALRRVAFVLIPTNLSSAPIHVNALVVGTVEKPSNSPDSSSAVRFVSSSVTSVLGFGIAISRELVVFENPFRVSAVVDACRTLAEALPPQYTSAIVNKYDPPSSALQTRMFLFQAYSLMSRVPASAFTLFGAQRGSLCRIALRSYPHNWHSRTAVLSSTTIPIISSETCTLFVRLQSYVCCTCQACVLEPRPQKHTDVHSAMQHIHQPN